MCAYNNNNNVRKANKTVLMASIRCFFWNEKEEENKTIMSIFEMFFFFFDLSFRLNCIIESNFDYLNFDAGHDIRLRLICRRLFNLMMTPLLASYPDHQPI